MIPSIAIIHVYNPHWRSVRLWIPLFLLWIPLLLLSPLIFLGIMAACLVGQVSPWRTITAFWTICCSLPGTHVHVSRQENKVLVRIL